MRGRIGRKRSFKLKSSKPLPPSWEKLKESFGERSVEAIKGVVQRQNAIRIGDGMRQWSDREIRQKVYRLLIRPLV